MYTEFNNWERLDKKWGKNFRKCAGHADSKDDGTH